MVDAKDGTVNGAGDEVDADGSGWEERSTPRAEAKERGGAGDTTEARGEVLAVVEATGREERDGG